MMKRAVLTVITVFTVILVFVSCTKVDNNNVKTTETKDPKKLLLEDLTTAYQTEYNDVILYKMFADDADEEGYKEAAVLFRAVSKSESIIAENHLKVIKELGGDVKPVLEKFVVNTTKDELQSAADDETFEYTVSYPQYINDARVAGNVHGIRTLDYALAVEKTHAGLYTDGLNNLPEMVEANHSYWVCPVCGNTFASVQTDPCANCSTPAKRFIEIK